MDLIAVGTILFFALTCWGMVTLCQNLMDEK